VLLLFAKDVDAEMRRAGEGGIAACSLVDAYQHQRRIERDRGKGVGGEALRCAFGIERRGHGDAGRKTAERSPQFSDIERCSAGLPNFLMLHHGLSELAKLTLDFTARREAAKACRTN
jgi:hypothetical protein